MQMFYLAGGISKNFFGIGKTVGFVEYEENKGGLAQAAFLNGLGTSTTLNVSGMNGTNFDATTGSKATFWGLGAVQYIDAAAMEVFVSYRNYSLETNGFMGANNINTILNKNNGGTNDFQTVIMGTKINF